MIPEYGHVIVSQESKKDQLRELIELNSQYSKNCLFETEKLASTITVQNRKIDELTVLIRELSERYVRENMESNTDTFLHTQELKFDKFLESTTVKVASTLDAQEREFDKFLKSETDRIISVLDVQDRKIEQLLNLFKLYPKTLVTEAKKIVSVIDTSVLTQEVKLDNFLESATAKMASVHDTQGRELEEYLKSIFADVDFSRVISAVDEQSKKVGIMTIALNASNEMQARSMVDIQNMSLIVNKQMYKLDRIGELLNESGVFYRDSVNRISNLIVSSITVVNETVDSWKAVGRDRTDEYTYIRDVMDEVKTSIHDDVVCLLDCFGELIRNLTSNEDHIDPIVSELIDTTDTYTLVLVTIGAFSMVVLLGLALYLTYKLKKLTTPLPTAHVTPMTVMTSPDPETIQSVMNDISLDV